MIEARSAESPDAAGANATTRSAAATVAALAALLRSIAVYPPQHPRAVGAATQFMGLLAERSGGARAVVIGHRDNELLVDGDRVAAASGQSAWLLQRWREATLRGVVLEPTCTVDDVVGFATLLGRARGRAAPRIESAWPADHPRLRVLSLRYAGDFDGAAAAVGLGVLADPGASMPTAADADADADAAGSGVASGTLAGLLAADAGIQRRLQVIQAACSGGGAGVEQDADLLTRIAGLLPADVASDADRVLATTDLILAEIERELPSIVQEAATVEGAELLRRAVDAAQRFFRIESPARPLQSEIPSGRPEDVGIGADFGLLRDELAALPPSAGLRLPSMAEWEGRSAAVAAELLGINLHAFVHTDREEVRAVARLRIRMMCARLDDAGRAVLRAYLGSRGQPAPCPSSLRCELIGLVVDAGETEFVRGLGLIDTEFIVHGYPESLRIAARMLGVGSGGLTVLRNALEKLAPMLAHGGIEAAVRSGVLKDPYVIDALLDMPGSAALPFLEHLIAQCPTDLQPRFLAALRARELPAAIGAVLAVASEPGSIPVDWLRDALRGAVLGRFDPALHERSAELLCQQVERGLDRLPLARQLFVIGTLRHAPGARTVDLLERLMVRRRWSLFDRQARAIRNQARATLAVMTRGGR